MYFLNLLINHRWADTQIQKESLKELKKELLKLKDNENITHFRIDRDNVTLMFVSNNEYQRQFFLENIDKIDARLK